MTLLSADFHAYAAERLEDRSALLAPLSEKIEAALAALETEDERALMRSYLGTLPLTDVFDTPLETLASFARQSALLRAESPWCRDVPEDVFVHFVAYPRVNNEPLADAWPVFRAQLGERLAGLDAEAAVLETNYWCCETATYQASDGRTLGPLGVLASGDGRCGEESTYLVTALRSVGIPARQLYTPWWAHCDDNHAWVEAYTGDGWHYLGACEPEEQLDRGWFTAASGRAMLVHTRLFGDFGCDFEHDAHLLAREGSQVIVNLTERYAPTVRLVVRVADASGAPVEGSAVRLQLVNEAGWRDIASLVTGPDGSASIVVGEGTLRVAASIGDTLAEKIVDTSRDHDVTIVPVTAAEQPGGWEDIDVHAPSDHPAPSRPLTPEQAAAGRARKREADAMRTRRVAGLVAKARELAHADALSYLAREGVDDPGRAEDLYRRYVLCPRANLEHLSAYRAFIRERFDAGQVAGFVADPMSVWSHICATTSLDVRHHVKKLVGTPVGALVSGQAGEFTRRALFVAICRTFGIPARVNTVDLGAEFFRAGGFVPVERPESGADVTFASEEPLGYFHDWTIARLTRDNAPSGAPRLGFATLDLWGKAEFEGGVCHVELPAGTYLVTTSARLPSGDSQVAERLVEVGEHGIEGADGPVELVMRHPDVSQMLEDIAVEPFMLADGSGDPLDPSSAATEGQPIVTAFLEPGMEPTEHLLNEMREESARLAEAGAALLLVLRDEAELADPTLSRTLPVLEGVADVTVAFDDFSELPERLARRMFVNPEKLPLCILATPEGGALRGRYAAAGYNVGTVDLMLKLMALL